MRKATKSPEFPGYYEVPGNSRIVIKPDGECKSTHTGRILNKYINNGWYPRIISGIKGDNKSFLLHRLMAMAFIDVPDELKEYEFRELHVNHKDGIKTNFNLDNLEWCLPIHNVHHAFNNCLQHGTIVLARNILTDVVTKFPGINTCANKFNITRVRLNTHLKSNQVGKITCNWHVFKLDDGTEWPELKDCDLVEDKWALFSIAIGRNIDTDKILLANTLDELCGFIGIPYSTFSAHRKNNGTDIPLNGWIIEVTDIVSGIDVSSIKRRLIRCKTNYGLPITVINTKTDVMNKYQSAHEFARVIGVSGNSITTAIVNNNGIFKHFIINRITKEEFDRLNI